MSAMSRKGQSGLTLIELLMGIVIAGIISTMLLMGWFSLQRSYAYSVNSNMQRDSARQALSRMQAEVRDSQAPAPPSTQPPLVAAFPYWIEFSTTFNTAGDVDPTHPPRLVIYRLYSDKTIWRFEDLSDNGVIAGVSTSPSMDPGNPTTGEQTNGEGARLLLKNVTNYDANATPVPLFRYMYYDQDGALKVADSVSNATYNDRSNTVAVLIHVLEDLNPKHSPVYADLQITAQLRYQR